MRITKQNRETLLSQLAEAGEEGLPHRRLTSRGTYTAIPGGQEALTRLARGRAPGAVGDG